MARRFTTGVVALDKKMTEEGITVLKTGGSTVDRPRELKVGSLPEGRRNDGLSKLRESIIAQ
jgi:hypothetical protein